MKWAISTSGALGLLAIGATLGIISALYPAFFSGLMAAIVVTGCLAAVTWALLTIWIEGRKR